MERIKVSAQRESRGLKTKTQVRNLGVLIDSDLCSSSYIKAVTKTALYHTKQISRARDPMSRADLENTLL